jgi:3-oxoacyl-[acyl-carrier protein] reductase
VNLELYGKAAVVTGGNVGIGRAIALALAEAGADVAVTYLSHAGDDVADEIQRLGRRAVSVPLDATDSRAVDRVMDELSTAFGGHIDILVNNAGGLGGRVMIADMDDQHWHRVLDVNLSTAFYCTRAVLRHMGASGGRIVNISSLAAHNGGGPGSTAYAAAKAALVTLTRGLAKELGERGITVNAVAPGLILDTPFHKMFTPEENQRATIATTPLRRAGYPRDVAGAVLFLASDMASFITGEVLEVNGGTWFA